MIPAALATSLAQRHAHYGRIVAAVTFLTMLVMAGALGAPGVFMGQLQKEFGWNSAAISSTLTVRFSLFGLLGPFASACMSRVCARRTTVFALAVVFGGLLLSLFVDHHWQLVLLWGVVVGLGSGLIGIALGAQVATRWFSTHRGLVVGMMFASSATGQLVLLPLMAHVTEKHGCHVALAFVLSGLGWAVAMVALLMRNTPAELGPKLLSVEEEANSAALPHGIAQPLQSPLKTLRAAVDDSAFWVLFGTFFIGGTSTNGLVQTTIPVEVILLASVTLGVLAVDAHNAIADMFPPKVRCPPQTQRSDTLGLLRRGARQGTD